MANFKKPTEMFITIQEAVNHYPTIPQRTIDAIYRYVEDGILPGGFLTAVLENNLRESMGRGDFENIAAIFPIVDILYNYAPANCWGSPEKIEKWLDDKPRR